MAMKESYYTVDGQMLGYKGASGRKDFLRDNLGSVTAEIDQTGSNRTFDGRYRPYGNLLWSTGNSGKFGWVGSWGYRSTGLKASTQYVRARHYNYVNAMWTTEDRLWPNEKSYIYARSNPILLVDFYGYKACLSAPNCSDLSNDQVCPPERCPGGKWQGCPDPSVSKKKCKSSQATCLAISRQVLGNDGVISGQFGDDSSDGGPWVACTSCCQGASGPSYRTACCSNSPFFQQADPCISFCVLVGHEKDGHGRQECETTGDAGGTQNEIDALICERSCLMEAWKNLKCSQYTNIKAPPPNPPGKYSRAICNVDRKRYF